MPLLTQEQQIQFIFKFIYTRTHVLPRPDAPVLTSLVLAGRNIYTFGAQMRFANYSGKIL